MHRAFNIAIRIVVAFTAYYFIAVKIGWVGLSNISSTFSGSFQLQDVVWFGSTIALMPLVWALEAYKWKFVLSKFTRITFWSSWRSVWYGVVAGQLTPNRTGEPIGRLALIDPEVRGKAGVAAVWCSLSQQLATLFFGLISLVWWLGVKGLNVLPSSIPLWLAFCSLFCWAGLLLFGIIKVQKIAGWVARFDWVKKALHGESLTINFRISTFTIVLIISIIRYLVFSTQYAIMLRIFGVNANIFDLYSAVGLTYLFSSFIPSFSLSEVGVRAGFALWFAGMISESAIGITVATLFLWMLNIALPALIAAWFPWRKRE